MFDWGEKKEGKLGKGKLRRKMDEKKNGLGGKLGPQILILPNQEGKHKGKVGEQTKFYIYHFVPIHVMVDS